jgi:hypothetical protein
MLSLRISVPSMSLWSMSPICNSTLSVSISCPRSTPLIPSLITLSRCGLATSGAPLALLHHTATGCTKEGYSVPPDTQDSLSNDGKPHFVETLHILLRVLTPSFTGFNSKPNTNLPELVGWEGVLDSPSSVDSFSPPPLFTALPDSSGKEVSPEVTTSMHSRIDGSASPFDTQTWANAAYEPPKIATPNEWPEVDPNFFNHLSGTTLPEPDSYTNSTLIVHSGELQCFSKFITPPNQVTTLTTLGLLEELGWVIAKLLNTLKIEGDEGMNEEMVKYKDAFTFPEWLHILGAIEALKE